MPARPENAASPPPATGAPYRDAFRLLCILTQGSEALPKQKITDEYDRVFRGTKRVQAIDFLVRYPDYLADKLIDLHEDGEPGMLAAVEQILAEKEPELRCVQMVRWKYGAYEDLSNALGVLSYRKLTGHFTKKLPAGREEHEYHIGPRARDFLQEAFEQQSPLKWYDRQTRLAIRAAQGKSGSLLKDEQYQHESYASTPMGGVIPSIRDQVESRYRKVVEGRTG